MSEFDFWEFVACAKCQLPFASGSTVPFWLTECGHTVCNNHLNADQSCSVCASPDIQVIPLQQEMDAPMSEWFRSVPHILDAAAFAAKFQQESMASQIRTLKARHQQQRSYTERLKKENAELRQTVEMLMAQLSDQAPYDNQEPSSIVNSNGKRPLIDSAHRPPSTSSSPHSAIGTNRLTIPAGQQPPHLSSNRTTDQTHSYQEELSLVQQRPGSSKFTQQYAFAPSGKPQMRPPTHQSTHRQPGRNTMLQEKPQPPSRMMPPPRMPDNKSAPTSHNRNIPQSRPDASASKFHNQNLASPANHRFPSGNNGKAFVPAAPVYPPERLGTGIGRTSTAQGSTAVDSRALPRSSQPSVGGGSHRRPFVPR